MKSLATRFARWNELGSPVQTAVPGGQSAIPGTPILTQQFGQQLYLAVQIAWGANLASSPSTWQWTDVTGDVQSTDKVNITVGGTDAASKPQPAQLTVVLDNREGLYSRGGQSLNYPNVHEGTPVWVIITTVDGYVSTRFLGQAVSWIPATDSTGNYAVVHLTAAGAKRKYIQNSAVVTSPMTRALSTTTPAPLAYWPLEDGKWVSYGAPAIGTSNMSVAGTGTTSGTISWAGSTAFPGCLQAVVLDGPAPTLTGNIFRAGTTACCLTWMQGQSYTATVQGQAYAFLYFAASWQFGAQVNEAEVIFNQDGSGTVKVFKIDNSTTTICTFAAPAQGVHWMALSLSQSGSTLTAVMYIDGVQVGTGTMTATLTALRQVTFEGADTTGQPLAIGQVAAFNTTFTSLAANLTSTTVAASTGFTGESTEARMARLAAANSEPFSYTPNTAHQQMGPQRLDSYINLMEDCAKVEQGLLYDGFSTGLSFVSFAEKCNQTAKMTLNAAAGQVEDPILPVDDDRQTLNTFTAARINGATYTYQRIAGERGSLSAGIYSGSDTLDFAQDGQQLRDYASWRAHVGTDQNDVASYRYPNLIVKLHHHPELLTAWGNMTLWGRIDVTGMQSVRKQANPHTFSEVLEGYSETIDQFTWTVSMNTSPYEPYRVGVLAATTGDTGENLMRLQTRGSAVVSGCSVGGTTITVANSGSEPLWVTAADDFPLLVEVGGNVVTVTAISGASSPQTFTLDPTTVLYQINSAATVKVWTVSTLGVLEMI